IHGSAFETRRYRVEFDPEPGVIRVYADGIHLLDIDQLPAPRDWKFAALRALDTAEFSDMTVGPTSSGAYSTETLHD
ncbi:MAG: hypothetical protein GVY29_02300, partial [Spirochaetes bacterium]|nr:hypothetical protein [Spirochaetota bacterium]